MRLRHRKRGSRRLVAGVALMEVLVSMAVIGIGMGTLLQTMSVCVRSQSRVEERGLARRLAETKAVEIREGLAEGAAPTAGGPFAAPYEAYEWASEIQDPRGDLPFSLLKLSVSRAGKVLYREQIPVARPEG